ncbi:hypothetical protein LHYA1_G000549 [Lachnellula hyalina]|uniref:CFEM domain-containing protein n=1 Tax=Lachnellula hyalina TaxID=1316788 RepID=A0A8H8RAG5_9HELO|nr:uncharacterized protein LHYA1_G000549 [Lachnellula hyalina]TVY30557.1 hypothetical protein LHYA1_G000549 [Lachnellula hyalina]
MKLTYTTVIAILAAVAQTQSIADLTASLPACSLTCLQTAITGAGCSITDNACQCGSAKAGITSSATPCLLKACQVSDALNVQTITGKICDLASVTSAASSAASVASSAVASTTSAPAASNPGSKVEAFGMVGAAAMLAAMAL